MVYGFIYCLNRKLKIADVVLHMHYTYLLCLLFVVNPYICILKIRIKHLIELFGGSYCPSDNYYSVTINSLDSLDIASSHYILLLVIGAQIATQENLKKVNTVEFPPSDSSTNNNNFMMFGNMTPMIQIPSSVIINQIAEEGVYT